LIYNINETNQTGQWSPDFGRRGKGYNPGMKSNNLFLSLSTASGRKGLFAFAGIVLLALIITAGVLTNFYYSDNGIEIIVFTWDQPIKADIPEIHTWKDGHAIWVESNLESQQYEFYETYLSNAEITKVKRILINAGYWNDKGQGLKNIGSSEDTIWTNLDGQEKSVLVRGQKLTMMVSSLHFLLNSSTRKQKYIPNAAYLFANSTEDKSSFVYIWPDEELDFSQYFGQLSNGEYVEGKKLATVWEAVQHGNDIISHGVSYNYHLKIPGISCVFDYDGVKDVCRIYTDGQP